MKHISLTPFGRRPVTAADLAAHQPAAVPLSPRDKWAVLDDLRTARAAFGVTDRDLAVLHALLTFLPGKVLDPAAGLVVFPSNASLSDRAHGMAESTLRRHLAALVAAGLLRRQDSPNGKRYATRDRSGALPQAYGLDLTPLLRRADEIAALARAAAAEADALRQRRAGLVIQLRDATKLLAYARAHALPGDWAGLESALAPIRTGLRRRMSARLVDDLFTLAVDILAQITRALALPAAEPSAPAAHSGRHLLESQDNPAESEDRLEAEKADPPEAPSAPQIPLGLVVKACPDLQLYARGNLRSWPDLVATARDLHPQMGISGAAWRDAERLMGPEVAATTLAAILQRLSRITNPGGYLRALSAKAAESRFSPGPMILALLRRPQSAGIAS